jgi:hypothetical protein
MDLVDWLSDLKVTPFQAQMAAVALGGGIALLGARINSVSQARRERQAKEAERRHIFERDALVAVQDALDQLYRVVEDTVLARFPPDNPSIHSVNVPPEPIEYRKAEATVGTLQERVLDDDTRALVGRVVEVAGEVMRAGSRVTVDDRNQVLRELSIRLHERIGERLRRLYKP